MQYLFCAIAVYLLVLGLRYGVIVLQLRKRTIQYAQFQLQPRATVPAYVQTLFQSPIATLAPFGFKPCSYMQTQTVVQMEPSTAWELLLYHPELKTYAQVSVRLLAESADLFDFDFYTFFQDKTLLITTNGRAYGVVGQIPQTILQDPYAADLLGHWQTHRDRCQQLSVPACGLPPDRFVQTLQAYMQRYVDHLATTGILVKAEPGTFKLRWQPTLRQAVKTFRGGQRAAKLTQQRRKQARADRTKAEIPAELEVQSFQRLEYLQRDLVGRKLRLWLLLGSLAIFLATYTQVFKADSLALFMGALLLHEGGHLLAMKLFGYRNTALLFLPFLGALATADKEDATLSQKFWISLAGPLPGLILGIGLALLKQHGAYPGWITEASWILIGLNLFNLLPIYPLDGGQIADLLLFSRHPYLAVVFKSIGVLLLGLLGLAQPMLLLFAGLIALSLPSSFRIAKVGNQLRRELGRTPITERSLLLQAIFQKMQELGQSNLPFSQRYGLAKTLLLSHQELSAKGSTRAALGMLYSLSLVGGLIGTVQALLPNWSSMLAASRSGASPRIEQLTAERQQEVEQATAILQRHPDQADAYLKRAAARMWLQDHQGVLADYDQLVRLKPNDVEILLNRASYRSKIGNFQGAIQDYSTVLRLDPDHLVAYQNRALLRTQLQDYQGAIADYNQLIRLSPQDAWTYLNRGYARQELKDYRGAVADANQALQLEPDQPDAYVLRSTARRHLGDLQGATADQRQADALYQHWDEQ